MILFLCATTKKIYNSTRAFSFTRNVCGDSQFACCARAVHGFCMRVKRV